MDFVLRYRTISLQKGAAAALLANATAAASLGATSVQINHQGDFGGLANDVAVVEHLSIEANLLVLGRDGRNRMNFLFQSEHSVTLSCLDLEGSSGAHVVDDHFVFGIYLG